MQIKIIRRLKDVFIFHSSIYISLFLSLLRPLRLPRYLCPSPFVASVFPLSLISTASRVSRSFLLSVSLSRYSTLFTPFAPFISAVFVSCSLVAGTAPPLFYFSVPLVFSLLMPDRRRGVAALFTLSSPMHRAFTTVFTDAFLFQAFVTLKRLFPGKLGVSFMRHKQFSLLL